jgi:hypothetical protein
MAGKPRTIDAYLSALSADQRKALEKLRPTLVRKLVKARIVENARLGSSKPPRARARGSTARAR